MAARCEVVARSLNEHISRFVCVTVHNHHSSLPLTMLKCAAIIAVLKSKGPSDAIVRHGILIQRTAMHCMT
jgi:hypothetical protein